MDIDAYAAFLYSATAAGLTLCTECVIQNKCTYDTQPPTNHTFETVYVLPPCHKP